MAIATERAALAAPASGQIWRHAAETQERRGLWLSQRRL